MNLNEGVQISEDRIRYLQNLLKCSPSRDGYKPPRRANDSLRSLYKIGLGPSSSHTMGPKKAAELVADAVRQTGKIAESYKVTLFGSLAQTGAGHKTDYAIEQVLGKDALTLIWNRESRLKKHTNGMHFQAFSGGAVIVERVYYSVGGGILEEGTIDDLKELYPTSKKDPEQPVEAVAGPCLYGDLRFFHDYALQCLKDNIPLQRLVYKYENQQLFEQFNIPEQERMAYLDGVIPPYCSTELREGLVQSYLYKCWDTMKKCVDDGLKKRDPIDTSQELLYPRTAYKVFEKAKQLPEGSRKDTLLLQAFALAVAEQNGSASHDVVTAPTCGAAGVLPGLLYFYHYTLDQKFSNYKRGAVADGLFVDALAIAGVIGNVCRANASISGAEAGCQAEVGVAEAMAAAAAVFLEMSLNRRKDEKITVKRLITSIEWAARNSLKNRIGMTCDPVKGLVIDPCIQRNGAAAIAARASALCALDCALDQVTSFDMIVNVMLETGVALLSKYRETSEGGLAVKYTLDAASNRDTNYTSPTYAGMGEGDIEELK